MNFSTKLESTHFESIENRNLCNIESERQKSESLLLKKAILKLEYQLYSLNSNAVFFDNRMTSEIAYLKHVNTELTNQVVHLKHANVELKNKRIIQNDT